MAAKWVQQTSGSAVVVFVHGFLSSGEECWANANGTYWPDLVAKATPETSVYVTTYRTGVGSRTFSVNDVSDSLYEVLKLDGVLDRRLIVFVCHSMGGLVVRRMLVAQQKHFSDNHIGLFLVASPSLGSRYADWLSPIARFFKNSQADTLRMSETNEWLSALDQDFFNILDELDISGRELVEDLSILRAGLITLQQIVSPLSGERYFRDPLKIGGSDHFSIAKPADSEGLQHRVLMEFLRLRFAAIAQDAPPGSGALLGHKSLVDYIFAANQQALAALVASVPVGPGIGRAFVPERFKRAYVGAVHAREVGERVASASSLVRKSFPEFDGSWHLVSITDAEVVEGPASAQDIAGPAFHLAGLRGPRMLAAMIAVSPFPALIGARDEAETMLRKLLVGGAS
jgi:pimeloyl-ACP methyl ester carboxylesterase